MFSSFVSVSLEVSSLDSSFASSIWSTSFPLMPLSSSSLFLDGSEILFSSIFSSFAVSSVLFSSKEEVSDSFLVDSFSLSSPDDVSSSFSSFSTISASSVSGFLPFTSTSLVALISPSITSGLSITSLLFSSWFSKETPLSSTGVGTAFSIILSSFLTEISAKPESFVVLEEICSSTWSSFFSSF